MKKFLFLAICLAWVAIISSHIARAEVTVAPVVASKCPEICIHSYSLDELLDLISVQYDIPLAIYGDVDGDANICAHNLNLKGQKPKEMLELIAKTLSISLTWVPPDYLDPTCPDDMALFTKSPYSPGKPYPLPAATAPGRTLDITDCEISLTGLIDIVGSQRKDNFAVLVCGNIDGYAKVNMKTLSAQVPDLMKLSPDEQLEKIAQVTGVFLTKIPKDHCFVFSEKPFVVDAPKLK